MAQKSSIVDALPMHFVSAMRTLFDIMDDQNTGRFLNLITFEIFKKYYLTFFIFRLCKLFRY